MRSITARVAYLVLAAQVRRHVDEVDRGRHAQRREHRARQLDPRVRLPGADVHQPKERRPLTHVHGHLYRVLDVDEVAPLFTVAELRPVALEQTDAAGLADLLAGLVDHAAHVPLVILVRAEDVEVLQADDAIGVAATSRVQIEQVLRVGVHVQWPQRPRIRFVGQVALEGTVGRGGGGVHEADAAADRPLGEDLGELEVVADEERRVGLGGGRAGAEVVDRAHVVQRAAPDCGDEIVGLDVIVEPQRREIAPLLRAVETIGDEDAVVAAPVERPHERAADEAGAASDQRRWHQRILRQGAHGGCARRVRTA